jgi:hypothetical protein
MALAFESVECARCGGSGRHSYCQAYGDTCFGCHGRGKVLTKRGAVAQSYLNAMRVRRADSISIGDMIRCEVFNGARYFARVSKIEPATCYCDVKTNAAHIVLATISDRHGGYSRTVARDGMIRIAFSREDKREQVATAIAYQDTLTKTGTVRKRAAAG